MKTAYALFLILSIGAAFWFGFKTDSPETETPSTVSPLPSDLNPQPTASTPIDLAAELANREPLGAADCIHELETWMQRSDALVNQFPLYDAIARAKPDALPMIAQHLIASESERAAEARHVLYLRWLTADPLSLTRHYFESQASPQITFPFEINELLSSLAKTNPIKGLALFRELAESGINVTTSLWIFQGEFYKLDHPPADRDHFRLAFIETRAEIDSIIASAPTSSETNDPILSRFENAIDSQQFETDPNAFASSLKSSLNAYPESVYNALDKIPDARTRDRIKLQAIAHLAATDPNLSLKLLTALYPDAQDNFIHYNSATLRELSTNLTSKHIDSLKSWFASQDDSLQAAEILTDIINYTSLKDLTPLDLTLLLPESNERAQLINRKLSPYTNEQWTQSLEWVENNLSGPQQQFAFSELVESANPETLDQRLKLLDRITSPTHLRIATNRLVSNWAHQNFDDALNWTLSLEKQSIKEEALRGIASAWIEADPTAYEDYVASLPSSTIKNNLEQTLAYSVSGNSNGIQSTTTDWTDLESVNARSQALAQLNHQLLLDNPQRAIDSLLVAYQQDPQAAAQAANSLASAWSDFDPLSAGRAFFPIGGPIANETLYTIVNATAQSSPDQLLPLVSLLQDPQQRSQAVETLTYNQDFIETHPNLYQQLRQLAPPTP